MILVLVLLERVHLIVVVLFGEEHGCALLVQLVPKRVTLLNELIVRRLVMLVIKLEGLYQVTLDHLGLLANAPDSVVHAALDIDESCTHGINDLFLLLDKVLVKLGVRLRQGSREII